MERWGEGSSCDRVVISPFGVTLSGEAGDRNRAFGFLLEMLARCD